MQLAQRLGIDVVVIDHHRIQEQAETTAVWSEEFCGAGLAAMFAWALALRAGWNDAKVERLLSGCSQYAAIASIADCVPLLRGTAKSLAYSPSKDMLYVVHSFGPDHIRIMSVSSDGKLTQRMEKYTCNTPDKPHRVPTQAVLSPDEKFLLVGTTFDVPIAISGTYPDGSPILWVTGPDGETKSVASNAPDPDGIVIHRVNADGTLGEARFQDGGGGSPFYIAFLHNRPDTFIIAYAVGDGVALGRIDEDGRIGVGKIVPIDTRRGKIAELCWASVSPDDRFLYGTVFGYSHVTTFHIDGLEIRVAKDPACSIVEGDGTFRGLCGDVSSGPSDNWVSPDGEFLYQIYGNASKLVGYATKPDGSLEEVTSVAIPYNSPEGLAGF